MTIGTQGFGETFRRTIRAHWSVVLLALFAMPYMSVVIVAHSSALSPIDEWVYVDALVKFPAQGIVHEGELVGPETLAILSCHGISPFGTVGPDCGTKYDPEAYPNAGLSTAASYVPLYFAFTRIVGDGIHFLTGAEPLTAWRLTGLMWLLGGLLSLYVLVRSWGASHLAVVAVGAAFITSPFSWWTYSYVSTDAPAFLFGALLLLLATRAIDSRVSRWWLLGLSALAIAVKISNLIGVSLALLFLIIDSALRAHRTEPGSSRRVSVFSGVRAARFAAVGLVIGCALQVVWLALTQVWAVSPNRADQGITIALTPDELLLQFANFLPGTITSSPISAYVPSFVYAPLGWLTITGVLVAVGVQRALGARMALVLAVGIASVCAAPALAAALEYVNGAYFQLPPRYGATLLPGFLLLLAFGLRNRIATSTVIIYSGALLVLGLWLSFYLATLA